MVGVAVKVTDDCEQTGFIEGEMDILTIGGALIVTVVVAELAVVQLLL